MYDRTFKPNHYVMNNINRGTEDLDYGWKYYQNLFSVQADYFENFLVSAVSTLS